MTVTGSPRAARAGGRPVPGVVAIGRRRVGIELKTFFRDKQSAVFNFALPVLLLVIFGSIFGSTYIPAGLTLSQYFVTGMIASGIVYTSFQNLAIAIPMERDDGTLKRLQGTPMPRSAYFAGKVGLVLVCFLAQMVLLTSIGVAFFDLDLPGSVGDWVTFTWVALLGIACFTLLGIAYSVVPRNGRGAPALVSPVVLVLQFTSGVFFEWHDLPSWMQHFAAVFPLKWVCQGMRSVFLPDAFQSQESAGSWELGRVALVLGGWTLLALVLALVSFRWTPRGER